jgi:hypothetical protein
MNASEEQKEEQRVEQHEEQYNLDHPEDPYYDAHLKEFQNEQRTDLNYNDCLFVVSIMMIIMAMISIINIYIDTIMLFVSEETFDSILCLSLIIAIWDSPKRVGSFAYIWGFLFACGVTATTYRIMYRVKNDEAIFFAINAIIHGITAVYLRSSMTGFTSVAFIMALLEYNIRQCFMKNRDNFHYVPMIITSCIITTVGTCYKIIVLNKHDKFFNFTHFAYFEQFLSNMLWMGPSTCYFTFLEFCSYSNSSNHYVGNNIFVISWSLIILLLSYYHNIPQ